MRMPYDVKLVKKLIEDHFKLRCRTVRKNMELGYEKWEEFHYFVNGEAIMSFVNKKTCQELEIRNMNYYKNKVFIRSVLLMFPDMVLVICA